MLIRVAADGSVVDAVYHDDVAWASIGEVSVTRASHVEYDHHHHAWFARIPQGGQEIILGPFARRRDAIAAEVARLNAILLNSTASGEHFRLDKTLEL